MSCTATRLRQGLLLACVLVLALGGSAFSQDAPKKGQPPTKVEAKIAASHIQICYKNSAWSSPKIKRSKEDAFKLAQEIRARIRNGEEFDTLATELGEDESKAQAGYLGIFEPKTMVVEFSRAAKKLKVGEISNVVESPFGYHIIRREKAVRASHVVISYEGTSLSRTNKKKAIKRTKEEAFALAGEIRRKALLDNADFAVLARTHSDGPTGPNGGDLGFFAKGQYLPEFEKAAMELEVGQLSEVVETTYGYHVILRTE